MSRDKQIEEMAEVIRATCKNSSADNCSALKSDCKLCYATALYNAGYRKASDVAREIFAEIEKRLAMYSHIHKYAEDAHKVTEEYADGSPVEMTSVWDACRLEHNGYDDYETMCQLQDNIGNIEKSRLLKEFECDIAQLKKKYESEGADDERSKTDE